LLQNCLGTEHVCNLMLQKRGLCLVIIIAILVCFKYLYCIFMEKANRLLYVLQKKILGRLLRMYLVRYQITIDPNCYTHRHRKELLLVYFVVVFIFCFADGV
jgi:hypothetical protein